MPDLDDQVPYWDAAASTKTFTQPLHLPWLDGLRRNAATLDYGCGYGRIMAELARHGFADLTGLDASPAMTGRARDLHPTMRFAALDAPPASPCPDAGSDAVLLFAVPTCVPGDAAQHRLITELGRPGPGSGPSPPGTITAPTMNGHESTGIQILARKPTAP